MRAIRNMLLLAAASVSLAACGTAMTGDGQSILIETSPPRHASCLVESDRGNWNLPATPQHLSISRGRGPLSVTCNTTDGWHGTAQVESRAGAVPVGGGVGIGAATGGALGMANAGGSSAAAVGFGASVSAPQVALAAGGAALGSLAIDAHTGALWSYPDRVVVRMAPRSIVEVPDAAVRAVERVSAVPASVAEPRHVRRRAPSLRGPIPQPHK